MEGPSLVILKEEVDFLTGKKITEVSGNTTIDKKRLKGQRVKAFKSFGKHFLIALDNTTIRIHFLMFGSYRINEEKDKAVRLGLTFGSDFLNFYTCSVALIDENLEDRYDWSSDVMSSDWDEREGRRTLKKNPHWNVGDALLNQTVFAGVGNIIKNEVLHRTKISPLNSIGSLPPRKLTSLVRDARDFSLQFYEWKKIYQLRKNLLIYNKKKCRRCDLPVIVEQTGSHPRRTFYCSNCQVLYD